jgi:hypothetical protein
LKILRTKESFASERERNMHLVDIGGMGRRVSDERDFSMVKFSYTYTYIYKNKQFNAHKVFVLLLRENEKL